MSIRRSCGRAAPRSGFTMIEIAICLAIIALALVAIIGVLPTGMNVQRDNRQETIINQDGALFLEAIRSGAQGVAGVAELTNSVEVLTTNRQLYSDARKSPPVCTNSAMIISALCTPGETNWMTNAAVVRALSGSAAEQSAATREVAFKYILESCVLPFTHGSDTNFGANSRSGVMSNHVYDVRLTFRWPIVPAPASPLTYAPAPNARTRVFRALVTGSLAQTNGYFFRP